MRLVMAVALLLALGACSAQSGRDFCAVAEPIVLDAQDLQSMTYATEAAIAKLNENGRKLCGW